MKLGAFTFLQNPLGSTQPKIDTTVSRNMVTGVLTDSTNQPKRPKIRSQSQPATKERPAVARTVFGAEKNDNTTLLMPKALLASHPTFDGKSEKFEFFEDLFRNNIKMYPHLTEIQKINYFHSLFRGDALKAFCNIEDSKKDSFEEIMRIFKTSFRRLPINGKNQMRMGCTQIRPLNAKLHEFLDVLQKTGKKAHGSEAQQFIDKAIYAKMPDHVKKILNWAYLEDKPYNDLVVHLEIGMRLNGLGEPDEVALVPLNKTEPAQLISEAKPVENITQNAKKDIAFIATSLVISKKNAKK